MSRRPWVRLAVVLSLATPNLVEAQGSIGIDAVIANRGENAFGLGLTYAWTTKYSQNLMGRPATLKLFGAVDLEIVDDRLKPGYCREPVNGRVYYYEECVSSTPGEPPRLVDYSVAEAPSVHRFYGAVYAVVDWYRIRLGGGIARGDPSGTVASALFGFVVSPSSWLMVEAPASGGWRLRIEMTLYGPPVTW